ncbi:diheme cytochrome c [Aliarcobacter cryaerophilus]|uniref:diheme cytochrome c n=1 Tax=Aliarcobacter cryaerophilus TaxID=28198 RepID=UPI0021B18982|nr:diheme cytochrome c [Aliarcobacter cryaerophilus]MCT7472719.1 diheme cytochrome c [Aliarcobacter cryaerophilus]MCT7499728.1 diheme cytochrome c [Aliarcobacter cryaerophilus]MCT7538661.1 diheme cytochrome c [Aliarcobacter cryaerophilus]MCT7543534.1 diheme cytochrome c [Aliarcobacter cryaerophilus]
MKELILLGLTSSFLFAGGISVSVKPVDNTIYEKECGSCHFAYPAGLLPSNSWNKMMSNLDNHFGDDATVDEKTFQTISSYLNENSAEKSMQYKRSRKIVENLNGTIPDSISKMPYMKKKHQDIKEHLITQKEVKGLFNCTACHQNAKKGIFSDDDVKIPNYGRWEKN